MKYRALAVTAFLMAPALSVAGERQLSGAEIETLLPTVMVLGEGTRQTFSAAGATTYTVNGRDTYGTWRIDKGQYCSQWPPARDWSCYTVLRADADRLIWVAPNGHRTLNTITDKK
ncbi:MAG: hypothetical protein AAGK38_00100 [Pseudomonadota bacterium]